MFLITSMIHNFENNNKFPFATEELYVHCNTYYPFLRRTRKFLRMNLTKPRNSYEKVRPKLNSGRTVSLILLTVLYIVFVQRLNGKRERWRL